MKTKVQSNGNYTAKRTLETILWLAGISLIILLLSASNANANTFEMGEELYIDDIPFDTELVVASITGPEFYFDDEPKVNDIPRNSALRMKPILTTFLLTHR